MRPFKIFVLLFAIISIFIACTDSDDYLFDTDKAISVTVSARMALSIDSINNQIKIDTVRPEDTLIFIADVFPSKSIHMQKYFWTLDDEIFATEFSFRKNISYPGEHHVALVVVDFFGDTLTDTLSLWVGNSPILDTLISIPADNSQELPADGPFHFAWHGFDPDSIYKLHYSFLLTNANGDTLVDTISYESNFLYDKKLNSLECYQWKVVAYNQLDLRSDAPIKRTFCTKGDKSLSAVEGFVKTSEYGIREQNPLDSIEVTVLDLVGNVIQQVDVHGNSNENIAFNVSSIPEGDYLLTATASENYPDFKCDTAKIHLNPNQVLHIDSLLLKDSIGPSILYAPDKNADTIDYVDTLRFIVIDGGSPALINVNTKAYLENSLVKNTIVRDDTILLVLPELADAWNLRLISITSQDFSGNTRTRTFYVRPDLDWLEINSDLVIDDQEFIQAYVKDINPFGFEPQTFVFNLSDDPKKDPYQFSADGDRELVINIPTSILVGDTIHASTQIHYTNGAVRSKSWTIIRKTGEDVDE